LKISSPPHRVSAYVFFWKNSEKEIEKKWKMCEKREERLKKN
jgi:hypothetical protein